MLSTSRSNCITNVIIHRDSRLMLEITVFRQINAPCALRDTLVNSGGPGEYFRGFWAIFAHFWPISAYFKGNIPSESAGVRSYPGSVARILCLSLILLHMDTVESKSNIDNSSPMFLQLSPSPQPTRRNVLGQCYKMLKTMNWYFSRILNMVNETKYWAKNTEKWWIHWTTHPQHIANITDILITRTQQQTHHFNLDILMNSSS